MNDECKDVYSRTLERWNTPRTPGPDEPAAPKDWIEEIEQYLTKDWIEEIDQYLIANRYSNVTISRTEALKLISEITRVERLCQSGQFGVWSDKPMRPQICRAHTDERNINMGCDIHCYVEFKSATNKHWQSFGERINPGRNYDLFGLLANVRSYGSDVAMFSPRGFPENPGFMSRHDYFLWVGDQDAHNQVNKKNVKSYLQTFPNLLTIKRDGQIVAIANPAWHSASWLTFEELEQVTDRADKDNVWLEWLALLAAMRELRNHGQDVRLVFWFDG